MRLVWYTNYGAANKRFYDRLECQLCFKALHWRWVIGWIFWSMMLSAAKRQTSRIVDQLPSITVKGGIVRMVNSSREPALSAFPRALRGKESRNLARPPHHDLLFLQEELSRATLRSTQNRQQSHHLFPSHQSQGPAFRTPQNCPVGIHGVAHVAGIFQHKNASRPHLFRNPLTQYRDLTDHPTPPYTS